jgi:uncharacterized protein (DUF4415 family)
MAKKSSASFQRARRRKASAGAIKTNSRQSAELAALAKRSDKAIDTRDIPEVTNWDEAEIGRFYRPRKQIVTIRLDADIVRWFKARSRKYQTAVNRVLREHVTKRTRRAATRPSIAKPRRRKSARG